MTDEDLPASEAVRARRRDRDMDAERRALMRPGLAKVFRQVTIPQRIREETGLLPNTEVDFVIDGGGVRILKTRTGRRPTRGEAALSALRPRSGGVSMTTDEIMALTRGEE